MSWRDTLREKKTNAEKRKKSKNEPPEKMKFSWKPKYEPPYPE